ncbi:MAG: NosD domain-containing protein [Candidatus Bathyarchaeia archaeon]
MRRKSASRVFISLVLVAIIMVASNAVLARVLGFGLLGGPAGLAAVPPISRTFFLQNFDNETAGGVPNAWVVNPASVGSFTVDSTTDFAVPGGNSAKFVDNSTTDAVTAFRYFTQQNGTIVFSFSVTMPYNTGNHTGLEVSVDDGSFDGSNIIFKDGAIQYFDGHSGLVTLSSYVSNVWYRIKFVMNVPFNTYDIHIDDHLDVAGAAFNGSCSQVQRMTITEYSPPSPPGSLLPIGYIDDIEGRGVIIVPTDFPTIQAAIDAASPGDVVYVTPRIYFDSVTIGPEKSGIWLVGQDVSTTIVDGKFQTTMPFRISLMGCSNVTVYGFTIRNSAINGAQVSVTGLGNTVTDNLIVSGLGDGIRVAGSNSTITDNVIQANQIGVNVISGQGNFVNNNTIIRNTVGLQCGQNAANSLIYGNRFVSNSQQALDDGLTNMWDDGYPYAPANKTGGGNYWSNFANCTDVRSGPHQDQGSNSGLSQATWPFPDGICDQPYMISQSGVDHYPLFLIQNVSQSPSLIHGNVISQVFDKSVEYKNDVTVTATTLKFVTIVNASLYVDYTNASGTIHGQITGKASGSTVTFTIPRAAYNTTVRYTVSVLANGASWLNTTSYPIPFPYLVDDMTPPKIINTLYFPVDVNESQLVIVYATVAEDVNASGVYEVFASYPVNNSTWWTAQMTYVNSVNGNYTATIPRQPGNTTLVFNVTAIDYAGIQAGPSSNSTYVKELPQMLVNAANPIPFDPCSIDQGAVSGDQTFSVSFNVTNLSAATEEPLVWNLTRIKDGPWLTSINPVGGVLPGGQTIHVIVNIDTHKCTDPGLYIAEMAVNSSGTVPQWAVIITFAVVTIIIDNSSATAQWPNRVDVSAPQVVAFHAEWAINGSSAVGGSIRINASSTYQPVDTNGWARFVVNSSKPAITTFTVVGVKFNFVTSFAQTVPNVTIAWDRVKVVLSMGNDNYVDVGSAANISWNSSYYELDGTPFLGSVILNDSVTRDHVDKAWISASSIIDLRYGLNASESNSIGVVWDEIKIIAGGVSSSQAPVNQTEYVWYIAVYEFENTLFRGENGSLYVSDGTQDYALAWSSDGKEMWRGDFRDQTSRVRTFQISRLEDNVHHLTKIKDGVGPMNIMWGDIPWWQAWLPATTSQNVTVASGPAQPVQSAQAQTAGAYAAWAVVIVVIVVIGLILTLFILMSSGKKSRPSNGKKRIARTNSSNNVNSKIQMQHGRSTEGSMLSLP